MARAMSVMVNIGAKVGSSVGSATSATVRQFGQMNRRLRVMAAETSAHMRAADRRWGSIRRNGQDFAMGVSAPMAAMATLGGRTAYEWAKVGNNLQAVTQMTHEQRKAIEQAARAQIGSPVDNLRAGLDLGRTGLSPTEIAAGLPIAVRLARSDPESVDQAQAADIVTNVIKGMRMPISELGRAADVIAYAAAQSSSDVRLMGESFKYAGPLATRAGTSIEEAAAAFMTMADAGIKGSESGVAFRSMLVRMIKLPKPAAAVLARYNMRIQDYVKLTNKPTGRGIVASLRASGIAAGGAAGEIDRILNSNLAGDQLVEALTTAVSRGIEGGADAVDREMLSTVISDALIGSADKIDWRKFIRDARAKGFTTGDIVNFFDTRQGARLATLFDDDMEANLARLQSEGGAGGFLNKMFAMQNQGVVGSMQRLAQSVGNLVITISETGIIDTFANGIDHLAKGINSLSKSNPGLLKFMTYSAGILAILAPLGFVLGGVASGFRALGWGFQVAWRMAAPLVGMLARIGMRVLLLSRLVGPMTAFRIIMTSALSAIAAVGWPVIAVIASIGLALAFIIAKWNGIKAFFDGFAKGFSEAMGPEAMASMRAAGEALKGVFVIMELPMRLVGEAVQAVFGWLGKLFAPAEAEKWRAGGASFGGVIGGMLKGMIDFIDKVGRGITLMREFFSVGGAGGAGLSMGLSTGGGAAGGALAGQIIGQRRARGGGAQRGSMYGIHENGTELFAPGRSGTVIPARASAALIAAMANGIPVSTGGGGGDTIHLHINGASDPRAVADEVMRRLEQRAGRDARARLGD